MVIAITAMMATQLQLQQWLQLWLQMTTATRLPLPQVPYGYTHFALLALLLALLRALLASVVATSIHG